ncbi:MAG: VOC family protein [Actinomycetota bacterium]|nr:VOC family protein [Actinomycetota bacterium]
MTSSGEGCRVHHSALVVSDIDRSLAFWRDGLGFEILMDQVFEGDWPTLFGAPTTNLRSVFLGDRRQPQCGLVELVAFADLEPARAGSAPERPGAGFLLLSLYVDLDQALAGLARFGIEPGAVIEVDGVRGPVRMATVRDPDGVLVELIDLPGT